MLVTTWVELAMRCTGCEGLLRVGREGLCGLVWVNWIDHTSNSSEQVGTSRNSETGLLTLVMLPKTKRPQVSAWWAQLDSNQRPEDYESPALTN